MYCTSGLLAYPPARMGSLSTEPPVVYPSPAYATPAAGQGYMPFGSESSAFYTPLSNEASDAWRSLSQTTVGSNGWHYDTSMCGYTYGTSYSGLDVRRKNATRESTSTLKAWLYEHIKNPYPTKGEKIMLAIITKMTLTQVSTWFANARRRLKKENKMQWSPRNRTGDDDDDDDDKNSDNDDVIIRERTDRDDSVIMHDDDEDVIVDAGNDDLHPGCHHDRCIDLAPADRCYPESRDTASSSAVQGGPESRSDSDPSQQQQQQPRDRHPIVASRTSASAGNSHPTGTGSASSSSSSSTSAEKPRIWSLADVATSGTPSSGRRSPASGLLPVRVNDFLNHNHHQHHHHHQRFPHDLSQAPSAAAAAAAALSTSGPSLVHHSFQPWAKRFLPSAHSVHPFINNKLLSGYVSYGHHHHHPHHHHQSSISSLGVAMTPSCSGSEVTRSTAATASAGGASDTGSAVFSSNQRIEFPRTTDKMTVAKNCEGFPLSLPLGTIHHSSTSSSSSNNNSNCSPSPSPSPSPPSPPAPPPPPPSVSSSSSFPSTSTLPPPPLKRL